MQPDCALRKKMSTEGFAIADGIYTFVEIQSILETIAVADTSNSSFRKTNDLFAIRRFLKELPDVHELVLTLKLKAVITEVFGPGYFIVKSIYFDKPPQSNWFVGFHQDLTISVNTKRSTPGFTGWTAKEQQYSVQPPHDILERNFTIRIHLDDTTRENGALKVIPGSHLKGIQRFDSFAEKEDISICEVNRGGIMIMRPLLFHGSGRSVNNKRRRVIHLEFSNCQLPGELDWSERIIA